MKRLMTLLIVLAAATSLKAGPIMGINDVVNISDPNVVDNGNVIQYLVDVTIYNFETRQIRTIGQIDLGNYGLAKIMYDHLVEDWVHDRVFFPPSGFTAGEGWRVLDLKTLTIYEPNSDSLRGLMCDLYITPNCEYLVAFYEDNNSTKTHWEDPNVISTYVFDASDFRFLNKRVGLSTFNGKYPPDFYFSSDGKKLFLRNPFQYVYERDLFTVSLPNLITLDTLKVKSFSTGNFQESIIADVRDSLCLVFILGEENKIKKPMYKLINLNNHQVLATLVSQDTLGYYVGKISPDGNYVAFQVLEYEIKVYDNRFNEKWTASGIDKGALDYAWFGDGYLIINTTSEDISNKYSLATGQLITQLITNSK